jgi:hypothetical protein
LDVNNIESLREEVSSNYYIFIQLKDKIPLDLNEKWSGIKADIQQLKQQDQTLNTSPTGGGTQSLPYPVSLVYDITSEKWTQLIFFLLSAVHYSGSQHINLQTIKNQCETPDRDPFDIFIQWIDVLRVAKNTHW